MDKGGREVELVRTFFRTRVGGSNFLRIGADVFYGRPLIQIYCNITILIFYSNKLTRILFEFYDPNLTNPLGENRIYRGF